MDQAQTFTVRVWRQAGAFRASVRAVGDAQAERFTEPKQMAQFLDRVCAPQPAATAAPTTPTRSSP